MIKVRKSEDYDSIKCTTCNKIILKAKSEAELKKLILNGYGEGNIICPHCLHVHLNPYYNHKRREK